MGVSGTLGNEPTHRTTKFRTKKPDSICTISSYQMFSPYRMRTFNKDSKDVYPFVQEILGETTCDRNSGRMAYIYDCSCAIVDRHCLEYINSGTPPQKWLGKYILGYEKSVPAIDLEFEWQLGQIEYCLTKLYNKNKLLITN